MSSDIISLGLDGLPYVKKSIQISIDSNDAEKLVETGIDGKIDGSLIPVIDTIVLSTPLDGFIPSSDLTDLTNVTTILEAFKKLQAQVHSKDAILKVEYLTGTTVLSEAQNAAIIDSISDCDIFLPPGVDNLKYRLKNAGQGKATLVPYNPNTIEKVSSYLIETSNAFDVIFLNGNWFIF